MRSSDARPKNAILAVVALAGIALAIFALVTLPPATRLDTFSAILVGVGTLELALVAFFQTQQIRHYSEEARRAAIRPLLIPDGQPASGELWPAQYAELDIRNVHGGPATNVLMVILPQVANRKSYFMPFYGRLLQPIVEGERIKIGLNRGSVLIDETDRIGQVPLFAPAEPAAGPTQPVARVTITCKDLLGLKHASIFDWTNQGAWIAVATPSEVVEDIHDIDERNQRRVGH